MEWEEVRSPPSEPLESATVAGVLWQSTESRFVMNVPRIASCSVTNGDKVRVSRSPVAASLDLRLFVQGLPLAAAYVQRGLLAWHAAAIVTPRGAVVIAGHSGVGKSTLAVAMARRGYELLADTVTPIELHDPSCAQVQPGMTDVALWRDAAENLGFDVSAAEPVRPGLERYYIAGLPVTHSPAPLHAIYLLCLTNEKSVRLESLRGQQRVLGPLHFVFNRRLAESEQTRRRMSHRTGLVLANARVRKLSRPEGKWSVDELVQCVQQDLLA